jgi:predicted DNA-binding protein
MNDDRFTVKKKQSSNKTIRLPDDMIQKLQALADKNDISFNQVVAQCCEFALEHMKDTTS